VTDALDGIFAALADPTRRQILARVADEGPVTPTRLAADLPISRQAVAKHLAVLDAAGLVAGTRSGREVHYRATPQHLEDARAWLADVGEQWDRRLTALRRHLAPER
jgi:DNA-binding transcriptional ArsR family regulator